jgi:transcriptional regulator with XRE-family HTH domain
MLYPKIRELRILHDLKQEYVAGRLGMSQPEYSRLENGHRHARIEDLRKLSAIYDVSLSALMLREQELPYGSRPLNASFAGTNHLHLSSILEQQEELMAHLIQKQQLTEDYLKEILQVLGREYRPDGRSGK